MNKYIAQVSLTASMVKEAGDVKNEIRDTAVIGAMGVGTGLISNHIVDNLKLNEKIPEAIKVSDSLVSRARSIFTSRAFKNTAKIGAIGGTVGLIGDYAAVKINKAMNTPSAENKYVEKIAKNTINKEF